MKFLKLAVVAACILFAVVACNGLSDSNAKEITLAKIEENDKGMPASGPSGDTMQAPPQIQKPSGETRIGQQPQVDWSKKIIKNASITIEVKNYQSFNGLLHDNIKRFGGYVGQEEQNQTDYKIENTIAIKVPVDQFDGLVTSLTTGDQKLIEKKITSEDVTTQVVDTRSRMEAKKQVRLKYLDMLKAARNMDEILNVQKEINGIQEDIEAASGRVEYLSHAAAYSTVNLTYFQVLDAAPGNNGEVSYGTKVWQSFKVGWHWIAEFVIGIISIWPLFFLGFLCWLAYKKWIVVKTPKGNA